MKLPSVHVSRLIAVITAGLALGACGSDPANANALGQGSGDGGVAVIGEAQVRVLHLSPGAPAVDVFVNGASEPAITGLSFREGTDYLTLPAGTYTFDIVATGASIAEPLLTVGPIDLAAGVRATAVAISNPSSIESLLLIDPTTNIPASLTRLRVVHVANGAPDVDVFATLGAERITLTDDLGYGKAATALDVAAGNGLVVEIDANDDGVAEFTFDVPALPAGALVNVFAVAENSQLSLVAQLPDGETITLAPRGNASLGQSRIRAVHLSPEIGPVDIYVNGATEPALRGLAYGESTAYLTLDADRYVIDVAPANTSIDDSIFRVGPVNIPGGVALTAVGFGPASNVQLIVFTDVATGIAPTDARVRIGHAAIGVGTVDVRLGGECGFFVVGNDLAIGEVGELIDVSAGIAYTATIDVDLDGVGDLTFQTPELPAGALIDVVATTGADGSVFLLAILPDGNTLRIDPVTAPLI